MFGRAQTKQPTTEPVVGIPVSQRPPPSPPRDPRERLSMTEIVALDLAAVEALPPDVGDVEMLPAPGMEWVPRPLVWVEADWALKAFTHVSTVKEGETNVHVYRCALHKVDGTPCHAAVRVVEGQRAGTVVFPNLPADGSVSAENHLLDVHGIVPPTRPMRDWSHSLVKDCCCTTACIDCMLAPCCFSARLLVFAGYYHPGDVFPSFKASMSCCDQVSSCCCEYTCSMAFAGATVVPACLVGVFEGMERTAIAKRLNISESNCDSCCIGFFCCPCSMVQRHHEVAASGLWPGYCCFDRHEPLPTPQEVQRKYKALTRKDVVRSRHKPNATPVNAAAQALARRAMH